MNDRQASSGATQVAASGQEQAVAAWIQYLNQLRVEELFETLRENDGNLREALGTVDETIIEVKKLIASNRGGQKGMHGFIAEIAETGVGNARSQVLGGDKIYQWIEDNGPVDLLRSGVAIQQKFSVSGGTFGLGAVASHFEKYPDFIENGAKYQIPSDQYATVRDLYLMSYEDASKLLSRSGGGPSFKDWQKVHKFFAGSGIPFEALEASNLGYSEVQRGTYHATLSAEKDSLHETHLAQRDVARQESKPSLRQGSQATLTASAVEGTTAFFVALVEKLRAGKKLREFTGDDWTAIATETGSGFATGGVRGFSIYTLTNFTATSAAAASAIVTAAFGVAEQANKFRRGEINEQEFIENAELVSLEAAVSALSSFVGQAAIPVPVLGAVIGNTVGMLMYRSVAGALSKREMELIERYQSEQLALDRKLTEEYESLLDQLDSAMSEYLKILEQAFSPDVEVALAGSITLALELRVASEEILDTPEKAASYFHD